MKKISKILNMFNALVKYKYYFFYCKFSRINNKNVWIISERGNDARDNGYHLFKYIRNNHPEIDVKYIISSTSSDYQKVKDLGDVVEYGSKEHYILFLTSGKLISTHILGYSPDMSLFWRLDKLNLLWVKGKKVFLQHGITQNYIDIMTSKVSKIDLFICGAKAEYEYILNNFGFTESVVKYTGFSRYDNLLNKEKNQILVMPTFRKWLNYESDFTSSEYFTKYNSLINNVELNLLLEKNNIKLVFYPHYEIQKYLLNFKSNSKNIEIADFKNYDVQKLLIESSILITDYSSVFFDFGYMNKPVLYYQFDVDRYRNNHYSEGYFKYNSMGFGSITNNEDDLIRQLKLIINNGISLYYHKRIKDFFKLNDTENSKRIFDEINKL